MSRDSLIPPELPIPHSAQEQSWLGRLKRWSAREAPLLALMSALLVVLGCLLVGYEPVGGDPDRLYRPLKVELKRALATGSLPWWSDRFGLGVPLVAESHVAAFYPPNLVLYRLLSVAAAYRLAMLLHYLALGATTYFLARTLEVLPWGAAMAGLSFTLCGFMTVHSSHEPFYQLMPYLPLALACTERWLESGRPAWAGALALVLGVQWTIGHFQIQAWTNGLVLVIALWRVVVDGRSWRRGLGAAAAVALGVGLAAVQLGPSAMFARHVGQTKRPINDLLFYSYPPAHWFEAAFPQAMRGLAGGPEGPYWIQQETTAYEAAFYVGTVPLVLAAVALAAGRWPRSTAIYRLAGLAAFAMATMPRWSQSGYVQVLAVPGLGYFRAPARYTLIAALVLAIAAGEGFDRAVARGAFLRGLIGAAVFALCAGWAVWSFSAPRAVPDHLPGIPDALLVGGLAWLLAIVAVALWRAGRAWAWLPFALAALELGILFHQGTTVWGWAVTLPGQSPVLAELTKARAVRVGGEIENMPLWAGMATAFPYLGFTLPPPNDLVERMQQPLIWEDERTGAGFDHAMTRRWLRRAGVTHLVGRRSTIEPMGVLLAAVPDPALDPIVRRRPGDPAGRVWSIVALDEPFPPARVALRARVAGDRRGLIDRLARFDDLDTAWSLAQDLAAPRADARSGRLVSWDGAAAAVEHDGACDLVVARTFDPGWTARLVGGPALSVAPVDGGLIGVRLEGSGKSTVALDYRPPGLVWGRAVSIAAVCLIVAILAIPAAAESWRRLREPFARARGRSRP